MSPQSSTLGRITGSSTGITRTSSSGMYRPEDNAYYKQWANKKDLKYFKFTNKKFTFSAEEITDASGFYLKEDLSKIFFCSGNYDTLTGTAGLGFLFNDNNSNCIGSKSFGVNGNISTLSAYSASDYRALSWYETSTIYVRPEPTGLSFNPNNGTRVIICGNLIRYNTQYRHYGAIIAQYDLNTAWSVSSITGNAEYSNISPSKIYYFNGGTSYSTTLPTTNIIKDIFVKPDGNTFYYIRDNTLYQGTISSSWDIGTNGANLNTNTGTLTLGGSLNLTYIGEFVGIFFTSDGKKLYITSKGYDAGNYSTFPRYWGPVLFEYTLGTEWNITTASLNNYIYMGYFQDKNPDSLTSDSFGSNSVFYPSGETLLSFRQEDNYSSLYGTNYRQQLFEYNLIRY